MSNHKINYIICGIPPSKWGVGRLISYLIKQNYDKFCIIYPNIYYPKIGLRILFKRKLYRSFFIEVLKYIYSIIVNKLIFKIKISHLKSKNIIIIHPQSIGFKNVIKLIENNNSHIFVMDCSFFCVKSYNHRGKTFNSCLLCLKGDYKNAKIHHCKPFPTRYQLNDNIDFLKKLNILSKKITFITQNQSQTKLIKKHYGNSVKVHEVGLFTNDFEEFSHLKNIKKIKNAFNIDFVYHGAAIEAKGLLYILNIASELNRYSFLIPASYEQCKKVIGNEILNMNIKNVKFLDINWENELKEYVINSKVVLCPSLWSAPIEGALIKSFIFNGVVALAHVKYSFVNDLPESIYCKLNTNNFNETIKILKNLIENDVYRNNLQENAQKWVKIFLDDNRTIVKKLSNILHISHPWQK